LPNLSTAFIQDLSNIGFITMQLVVAALLGGILGWERERHGRPAGLRTHILLCLGSSLFTIISLHFHLPEADPTRIAAQIVTGIGFIGAGTIMRQGTAIRGLTSATSLWTAAAIGMAVGVGGMFFTVAIIATMIAFFTLSVLNKWLEGSSRGGSDNEIILVASKAADLTMVFGELAANGVSVLSFRHLPSEIAGAVQLNIVIRTPSRENLEKALGKLASYNDVLEVKLEL
jgi:putative Mg2+ transporter-C (MgtC) family protein